MKPCGGAGHGHGTSTRATEPVRAIVVGWVGGGSATTATTRAGPTPAAATPTDAIPACARSSTIAARSWARAVASSPRAVSTWGSRPERRCAAIAARSAVAPTT